MSTFIAEFSDYAIHSIEYFIDQIETKLSRRDLSGLTNDKVHKINVSKQHPLASLMGRQLSGSKELFPGVIPGVSVTPGDMTDEGFTLGQSLNPVLAGSDFITQLDTWLALSDEDRQQSALITNDQITTIKTEYTGLATGQKMILQQNEWRKNENINISMWSDSPDMDILMGNLMDSIIAGIQVGQLGDDSKLKYFRYTTAKGLTNFNFGRVLFGTEYNLTFMNTYINTVVIKDDNISDHDFNGTFIIPGETA